MHKKYFNVRNIGVVLFALVLLRMSWRFYANPFEPQIIDMVNLVFHEAGHWFFMFFGSFLHTLGGTVFEIGIPLSIGLYALARYEFVTAGFCMWWMSIALWDVGIYAADASMRALPLLGDDPGGHDWGNMLGMLHLLWLDTEIGFAFKTLSVLTLCTALYLFGRYIKTNIRRYEMYQEVRQMR